ncbi:hypothetical protein F511_01737 [Dorcoceras hygrometricum]|uniref:Ribonuclease H1 N-terminal domain-containing protein n=1 Tax=Dorcoceras hygrometricum TaxID=472368 RepID=A0A2Z7AQZ7_9LAMI|nr:hypothetical protein F511_01737 [Dorcoceras hygrometricum]
MIAAVIPKITPSSPISLHGFGEFSKLRLREKNQHIQQLVHGSTVKSRPQADGVHDLSELLVLRVTCLHCLEENKSQQQPKSYVVFIGRQPDVYDKWSEASKQVCGFRGACYKGYDTNKEAEEAFSCYLEAMDATRAHKKCECEKTSTSSTSRPHRTKNSLKLVKVLRDLAVEIHDHAARMEKVVEEIGQILENMAVSDDE